MQRILKRFHAAPLSSSLFLFSILGWLITALYFEKIGPSLSFSFLLVFTLIFISCMISMTRAPVEGILAADHFVKHSHKRPRRRRRRKR